MSEGSAPGGGGKFLMQPGGVVMTQCVYCKNAVSGTFARVCRSFPGAIPSDILGNRFDHRKPHPDESPVDGVEPSRFEPRPDAPAAVLAALYRELDAPGG